MADVRHGQRDQRGVSGDIGRALGLDVAGEGADLDRAVVQRDAVEAGNAVEVDQQLAAPTAAC